MGGRKRVVDVEQLRHLIEGLKLQHRIVSEMTGIPAKKMTKFCRRYGIQSQRTGPRGGELHPGWRGGKTKRKGYWYRYSPDHPNRNSNGYVLEHRLVMEEKLGRILERTEVVHHIDGNTENNAPENLMIFESNAEHLRHELTGNVPNWSADGYARMKKAALRKHILAKLRHGDFQQGELPLFQSQLQSICEALPS